MPGHPKSAMHKRSKALAKRLADVAKVSDLHRKGFTFREIAIRLDMSMTRAKRRNQEALAQWRADSTEAVADRIAGVEARLLYLYREAVAAWERSKVDQERKRGKKRTKGPEVDAQPGADGKLLYSEQEIEVRKRDGDPRFIEQASKIQGQLMRLWGIDKQMHELTGDVPLNFFQLLLMRPKGPAVMIGEDGKEYLDTDHYPALPSPQGDNGQDGDGQAKGNE